MKRFILDTRLDPEQKLGICEQAEGFYIVSRDQDAKPLCSHTFSRDGIQWIAQHASRHDPTYCPECIKEKGIVILTVPHSNCKTFDVRDCDTAAMQMALALRAALRKEGVPVRLFPSPEKGEVASWRPFYDENRENPSGSTMRRNLKRFYFENQDAVVLAIDVHSFPPEHKQTPFYILDNTPLGPMEKRFSDFTRKLAAEVDIPVFEGTRTVNYIQTFFRSNGTPSFILEAREDLSMNEASQTLLALASKVSRKIKKGGGL